MKSREQGIRRVYYLGRVFNMQYVYIGLHKNCVYRHTCLNSVYHYDE